MWCDTDRKHGPRGRKISKHCKPLRCGYSEAWIYSPLNRMWEDMLQMVDGKDAWQE